ncbi:uncharacterized protein BDZ99DRAFT_397998 [Mytilinidion resinicola]|uniref:T6SS Phospholipase effector Tle1-like catalytic domain-containing protein n=1 Tax=Mytilinidion resinicola TaxID=574789 RepID=A0A6A6Y9C4_9PEZI|nr:uncharacterized protein BDZ99DRAFT_397998 [Mytilinidion resinicola]KAF2804427.1 hypothetical protein BDZ99DRAFT_397998 [Mytilinidion resinicola]
MSSENTTQGKRLIICCDGTSNDSEDEALTNVARISRCIDNTTHGDFVQITLYMRGIGTGTSRWANWRDQIVGRGIDYDIREAYKFICTNYSDTRDEIVLIGFSRGAFTVRAVAKIINDIGLLRSTGLRFLGELYSLWEKQPKGGEEMPAHVAQPEFKKLSFVNSEEIWPNVKRAIQALALDEDRRHFKPLLWKPKEGHQLEQYWFRGTHSDVGGGNKDATLANITLVWMISQLKGDVNFNENAVRALIMEDSVSRTRSNPSLLNGLEKLEITIRMPRKTLQKNSGKLRSPIRLFFTKI